MKDGRDFGIIYHINEHFADLQEDIEGIESFDVFAPTHPDKNFSALNKFGLTVKPGVVCCMVNEMTPINKNCYLFPVCGI